MTSYDMVGLLIIALGLTFCVISMPIVRLLPRQNQLVAEFGDTMVLWLARIFGSLLSMLGLVTLLQR